MAERTSSRAGSRRTTPQPAPQTIRVRTRSPPQRMMRKTRSQSRDISDSEDGRIGLKPRRSAKQATPDGTNGVREQIGSKSRKGKPANHAQVLKDLSVLAEEPSTFHNDPENAEGSGAIENVEDIGAGHQPVEQTHRSSGGVSTFSGTTARISFSALELTESSPEVMSETLLDLSDASEKLLSFVIPADLSEVSIATSMARLRNKGTPENKKLERLSDTLKRQRIDYGGDSYIDVGGTLRRLLGRKAAPINEQTASWRPDAILQKANLAILVSRILSTAGQDQSDQFLEDIAGTFPRPFIQRLGLPASLMPECSALAEVTLHVALEVRTQEAIMLLARYVGKSNFDPDNAQLQVFYEANQLKGWPVSGLRTADLRREANEKILGRIEQMRQTFRFNSSESGSAGIEALRVNFPWTTFAHQILVWADQRLNEIKIQTAIHGPGAQDICQACVNVIRIGKLGQFLESDGIDDESDGTELRLELDTASDSHATSEQQYASSRPARPHGLNLAQFSADSKKSIFAAARLRQRETGLKTTKPTEQKSLPQNQEVHSDIQVASTVGPAIRASTPQRNSNEQVISTHAPANLPNGRVPSAVQHHSLRSEDNEGVEGESKAKPSHTYRLHGEAESNKENVAVVPEPHQAQTTPKRSMYEKDPQAVIISPIGDQDSDHIGQEIEISSDEGFQAQAESSNAAVQRRLKPGTKRPASKPLRPQRQSPKKVRVLENIDAHTFNDSADVARGEEETQLPPHRLFEEYTRANESAKQWTAVATKQPQRRSAWTSEETEMLLVLITEWGTSWKFLKEQDLMQEHVLEDRDQVALKDKARNMKMDFLKAGKNLPQNFERIRLSQLQIKRLGDGGVRYDPETGTRVDAVVID